MPEKVRASPAAEPVVHRPGRSGPGDQAALLLLPDEPDEPEPDEPEPEEPELEEPDPEDDDPEEPEDDESEDEDLPEDDSDFEDEAAASLLAGTVLVPVERLSLR
jgi:hypothetical protein